MLDEQAPEAVAASVPQGASALSSLLSLHTRFLYPFFLDRYKLQVAEEKLKRTSWKGLPLWECPKPHHFYRDEILGHVQKFLFSNSRDGESCAYLRVPSDVASQWFRAATGNLRSGVVPLRLVPGVGIEIFLSNQGVGMLSLALSPALAKFRPREAVAFNYEMAQAAPKRVVEISIPHPQEDPARWAKLPSDQQVRVSPAPSREAPIEERLGATGGVFDLGELISYLLYPLEDFDMRGIQSTLSIYTVARVDKETDFEHSEHRMKFSPLMSALTQVEEPGHAGAPIEMQNLADGILNSRHWAAVGLLGSAHIVADQPSEHPFNEQRVPIVRDKYFIVYTLALLQRLAIQRAFEEAGAHVRVPTAESGKSLGILRSHVLGFAVSGYFTQVSSRQVLHRFYRMAQEGLDIPIALGELRQAIADIDARHSTERQELVGRSMAESLKIVAKVQSRVEWIEIFLVSVYAAHLWHMATEEVPTLKHLGPWGILALAAIGGGLAALVLRPWQHSKD